MELHLPWLNGLISNFAFKNHLGGGTHVIFSDWSFRLLMLREYCSRFGLRLYQASFGIVKADECKLGKEPGW